MPSPKLVKIAGKELSDALGVIITIETPTDIRGTHSGFTTGIEIEIQRRATNDPVIEGFKFATNGDGKMKLIEGQIQLQDSQFVTTYDIQFKKAYISDWKLLDPNNINEDTREDITLKCGEISISAGGGSASFEARAFKGLKS